MNTSTLKTSNFNSPSKNYESQIKEARFSLHKEQLLKKRSYSEIFEEEESLSFSEEGGPKKKLKSQIKQEVYEEINKVVYSGKTANEIVEELRLLCSSKDEKEVYSTQEESIKADSDLCNFEILTSSDFL